MMDRQKKYKPKEPQPLNQPIFYTSVHIRKLVVDFNAGKIGFWLQYTDENGNTESRQSGVPLATFMDAYPEKKFEDNFYTALQNVGFLPEGDIENE